jgi:hypothetical protein
MHYFCSSNVLIFAHPVCSLPSIDPYRPLRSIRATGCVSPRQVERALVFVEYLSVYYCNYMNCSYSRNAAISAHPVCSLPSIDAYGPLRSIRATGCVSPRQVKIAVDFVEYLSVYYCNYMNCSYSRNDAISAHPVCSLPSIDPYGLYRSIEMISSVSPRQVERALVFAEYLTV